MAKFPSEEHAAVSPAAAAAAELASTTKTEDGNAPPWRPDDEYTSNMLYDVINSLCALSGPGNNSERFVHLHSVIHNGIGREEFGRGMAAFWRRLVDKPDVFPPKFWQLLFQSSLTALEKSVDRFAWA